MEGQSISNSGKWSLVDNSAGQIAQTAPMEAVRGACGRERQVAVPVHSFERQMYRQQVTPTFIEVTPGLPARQGQQGAGCGS